MAVRLQGMSQCHMPGPGLPRVPQAECGAAGDEVPENEPLLGLECWVSCGWDPTLLIQMRPPTPQASRVTQTTVDLCAKRALKSHLLPRSPGAGVPTGSLLPRESSHGRKHPQHRHYGGAWDFSERARLRGKSTKTGALGSFFWHTPLEAATHFL